MLRKFAFGCGAIFVIVGLYGFWIGRVGYVVQFDLLQSFIYLTAGLTGVSLSLTRQPEARLRRYIGFMAGLNLGWLVLGLTWPNFLDIFHLEIPEHIFHALVGASAALIADPPKFLRHKIMSA